MPSFLDAAGRSIASAAGHAGSALRGAITSPAGIGAGLGAAAGLTHEALRHDGQPKNYLGAGALGALGGGLAGGAAGGIAGVAKDVRLLHPELGAGGIAKGTVQRMGTGVSNFAQRQLHGLTGYGGGDAAYLDRIGVMGHAPAAEKAKLLNLRAEDALKRAPHNAETITSDLHHQISALHDEGNVGQHYRDLGMSSAPGAVKAMATNPREASKAIWNQLRTGGTLGTAMGVGVPLALGARDIARGDESAQGGRTKTEKALRTGASVGSGLLFGGLPLVSQGIVGNVAEAAAGRLGRAIAPARQPVASAAV